MEKRRPEGGKRQSEKTLFCPKICIILACLALAVREVGWKEGGGQCEDSG